MLAKPTGTGKCQRGVGNVEAEYDILHGESFDGYPTDLSDKNLPNVYESDSTSKRNFFLITNNIPDKQLGELENARTSKVSDESTISDRPESLKLDSIRSGESLIKHFNFDTSKYNCVTNKCIGFWRTLMLSNLKPIKCTLLKGSRSNITPEPEEEEDNSCMWYNALVELQKRKMDETAFAAIAQQCKLCDDNDPYAEFKKKQGGRYTKEELQDYEDLICLNYWEPKGLKIKEKYVPQPIQEEELPDDVILETLEIASTSGQSLQEHTCGPQDMRLSQWEPCECGRIRCTCPVDPNVPDADHEGKMTDSYVCECGRVRCLCKNATISQLPVIEEVKEQEVKEEVTEEQEEIKKIEEEEVIDDTGRILPHCTICESDCKCWEHKIKMSKVFLDDAKFELKCQERFQDKQCQTTVEQQKPKVEEETEPQFCIICGHHGCNCHGPTLKETRKYIEYFEFDKNLITAELLKKDSRKSVKSLTNAESISSSAFQQRINEHSNDLICGTSSKEVVKDQSKSRIDEKTKQKVSKVPTKTVKQKRLYITPQQRARDIARQDRVVLQLDKYGIPQLVRRADGRLAPKPATSVDML